jgi:hypothetical protein
MHLKTGGPGRWDPFTHTRLPRPRLISMLFKSGVYPPEISRVSASALADQRRRMSDTCTGVQVPPRAVLIPRAVSADD